MNICLIATLIGFAVCFLTGCGSTTKTTTTEYDANGKITKVVVAESDASDFSAYMASGLGNATHLQGDVTKCNIGWNGYGFSWLSVSGSRTKAPAKEAKSKEVLEQMAKVIKAGKTSIQTDDVSVNAEKPANKTEAKDTKE